MNPVIADSRALLMRLPLAVHELQDRRTRIEDAIVLWHLGVPHIDLDQWSLAIDGLVNSPTTLRFGDLVRYPKTKVGSVHNCCGSPFKPFEPTHRVSNVTWGGARLADVLARARPGSDARYIWSYGADSGDFGGVAVEAYTKDLPITRIHTDVLLAYEMNGKPLLPEHGFPVRLVVPGFYGTNSVKWLTRITLSEGRAPGPFTTRWYNDPVLDGTGRETGGSTPVWSIAPDSVIVSPSPRETVEISVEREVWGWTWADGRVSCLYIRTGAGGAWQRAELEAAHEHEWQRFSFRWTPARLGATALSSLAEAKNGLLQPVSGRRNAIREVPVNIA